MGGRRGEFERLILPHLAAAHDLARWLMRHPHDAEDVVQESCLKAFRAFGGYAGANPKAWLLMIVRNTCMTRLARRQSDGKVVVLQDVIDGLEGTTSDVLRDMTPLPEDLLSIKEDRRRVHKALRLLPETYREVLVLREFDDLSYREIANIVGVPVGTVMSRLARARERMRRTLSVDVAGGSETRGEIGSPKEARDESHD